MLSRVWLLAASVFLVGTPIRSVAIGQQTSLADTPVAQIKLRTLPATDEQLVRIADRAFIGVVQKVQVVPEKLPGVDNPLPIKIVEMSVERILFDKTMTISVNSPYSFRLFAEGSRPFKEGERLLLYLAADTENRLTQPVGIDSGHFRFSRDGKTVMNLKRNENLLRPNKIRNQAEVLANEVPGDQREQFQNELMSWVKVASETDEIGKPIPIDLLIARTKQLSQDK